PDPIVQAPNYSQSYNRYSYVFNNPLKYTDPTGYYGGRYGPPLPYAHGEGSAAEGIGSSVVYDEHGALFFGYANLFGNTGFSTASTETVKKKIGEDEWGNPIYEEQQVLVYRDGADNKIYQTEISDGNKQDVQSNTEQKPKFSDLSDGDIILVIVNAIRNARLEGKDYVDLNDLFEGPVSEGDMVTTIKIGNTETEVYLLIANQDDKIISVYGSDTQKGPYQNRYFKGHKMNGYWNGLKYYQYNNGEYHPGAIEVIWILFDGNNTDVFYKYIHPKH
ncbi:MAG: hypothetical protein C0591_03515, partial [Marinilabiliales bacterium]